MNSILENETIKNLYLELEKKGCRAYFRAKQSNFFKKTIRKSGI